MTQEVLKKDFIPKFLEVGEERFAEQLMIYATNKIDNHKGSAIISIEIDFMDYYDQFMLLYRKDKDVNYLKLAKIFRVAAHKIYRILLKKGLTNRNNRFLNVVN